MIKKLIPDLKIYSIKSGTKVFDWKIPLEWEIKQGWIKKSDGKKYVI